MIKVPTITLEPKDYGYECYKNRTIGADTIVDLCGGRFLYQQLPTAMNLMAVNVGGGPRATVRRALILGTNRPEDAAWMERYGEGKNNSFQIGFTNTDYATVSQCRIHDGWDSVRFAGTAPVHWTVEDTWITHNRDDAVENDASDQREGLVRRCLIDGTYVGISTTSGSRPGKLRFEDTLLRLEPMPGAHPDGPALQPGHKWFFKCRNGDTVDLVRTTFRVDQRGNMSSEEWLCQIPPVARRTGNILVPLGEVTEAVICWYGQGEYPYKVDSRIEVLRGDEARAHWDEQYKLWLMNHPEVPRFSTDPQSPPVPPVEPVKPELLYEIEKAPQGWRLDANLGDYADAPDLRVGAGDATLLAKVMWSDLGIHFGLRVADVDTVADTQHRAPWRQDSIEIFFDPTGDGGAQMGPGDIQLIVTPQGRVMSNLSVEDAGWRSVAALTSDGYIVEVVLPWPPECNRDKCRVSFVLNNLGSDGSLESVMLGGFRNSFKVPDKWMPARMV